MSKKQNIMAKKQAKIEYRLWPSVKGDLYLAAPSFRKDGSGKFALNSELSQQELKYIYDCGNTNIVYKVEG